MKIIQAGVGSTTHPASVRDTYGHALLPLQAHSSDGATTFKVQGRISTEAPWVDLVAAGTADFLQSTSWVPLLNLVVSAGTGTVTLWVGEE